MNVNDFLNAIGNIDDGLLTEALDADFAAECKAARKRKKRMWLYGTVAAAVVIVIAAVLVLPHFFPGSQSPVISDYGSVKIYMKINPYICINANSDGSVTSIEALNEDGELLLKEYSYSGKEAVLAASELITQASKLGYLQEDDEIIISVSADNDSLAEACSNEFESFANSNNTSYKVHVRELITESDAEKACLKNFGFEKHDVKNLKSVCYADQSEAVYQVRFETDENLFFCKVDAADSHVFDKKKTKKANTAEQVEESTPTALSESTSPVTEEPVAETESPETTAPEEEEEETPTAVPTPTPTATPEPVTPQPTEEAETTAEPEVNTATPEPVETVIDSKKPTLPKPRKKDE